MVKAMEIREATLDDIDALLRIRRLAIENSLRFDLTREMLVKSLSSHCKAFVLLSDNEEVVGFSMADKAGCQIWGLFVWEPYQGKGYGKLLLKIASNWLFSKRIGILRKKIKSITLSTDPKSNAHDFYYQMGWRAIGHDSHGDSIFELTEERHRLCDTIHDSSKT